MMDIDDDVLLAGSWSNPSTYKLFGLQDCHSFLKDEMVIIWLQLVAWYTFVDESNKKFTQ